jgi:hypothetical protein
LGGHLDAVTALGMDWKWEHLMALVLVPVMAEQRALVSADVSVWARLSGLVSVQCSEVN